MGVKERGLAGLDYALLHSLISSLFWAAGSTEVIRCGPPGFSSLCKISAHTGAPRGNGYEVGASVDYSYNSTVYASGALRRRCLPDGTWSGEIPSCYTKIENNVFWKEFVKLNRTLPFVNDSKLENCVQHDGDYSLLLKNRLFIRSLIILLEGKDVPQVETESGRLNSPSRTRWSGKISKFEYKNFTSKTIFIPGRNLKLCEIQVKAGLAAECVKPDVPYNANGRKITSDPSRYTIECKSGYQLNGQMELTCNDGKWHPSSPTCDLSPEVECKEEPEVNYGKLRYNSTKVNSTAWVECEYARKPSEKVIHCLPTGRWTTSSISCHYIVCDMEPSIPNGKVKRLSDSNLFGSKLQIICDKGYAATGEEIQECLSDGTWGHIDICKEIVCDSQTLKDPPYGKWIFFNGTNNIKILICDQGYYIKGFPAASLCHSNASWSFTNATCIRSTTDEAGLSGLSLNTTLLIAVAVGAGTAIFVLSLAMCVLMVKKRRHQMAKSSVFHVGSTESAVYEEGSDKLFFKSNPYEEVIELRNNPNPVPRKPTGTALPLIPIDTDPVYAQPFEATSEKAKTPAKNTSDLYTGHIYAEPVDSQLPNSALRTSIAKESWLQNGAINLGRKISLPGQSQTSEPLVDDYAEISKTKTCSSNRSSTSDTFKELNFFSPRRSDAFAGLINNSIYLDVKDRSLTSCDDPEKLNMINNDIYRENFSHA